MIGPWKSSFDQEITRIANPAPTIIIIGDSITAQNWSNTGTPNSDYYESQGFWCQTEVLLGQRFTLLDNKGTGGETSTQILARFSADVINNSNGKPDYVHILCGINDGVGVDTLQNIKDMCAMAHTAGIKVILGSPLPWDQSASSAALVNKFNLLRTNLREYARRTKNIIYIDYYSGLLDVTTLTTASQSNFNPSYSQSGGADKHPGPRGARIMADSAYTVLNPIIPKQHLVSASQDGTNGALDNPVKNSLMLGTTGTNSAGGVATAVPTNWTLNRTGGAAITTSAANVVARTDGVAGNWFSFTYGSSGAITERLRVMQTIAAAQLSSASIAVGDTVYAECEIDATIATGTITEIALQLIMWDNAFASKGDTWAMRCSTSNLNETTIAGVLRTRNIVVPTGTTQFDLELKVGSSVAGTGTVKVSRMRIVKVTSLQSS